VCNGIDNLPDPDEHIRFQVNEILEKDGIEQLQMMLKVFDPVFYEQIDLQNHQRLRRAVEVCLQTGKPYSQLRTHPQKERPFEIERVMLYRPIDKIYDRINKRVDVMLEQGLLNEAKHLYPHKNLNALNTMGYKEIFEYLDGKISLEQAITDIKTHSRRYAKKQLTWLKRQCIDGVIYLHS
jgi:tRNA dimethylallyltransferase